MKPSLWLVAVAVAVATATPLALADSTSTANGGAGGAGGSATGGAATGGTASNITSGVSSASGGQGGSAQGGSSNATGGNSNATGGNSNATGGSSNAQLGDVTVNYNSPSVPMGKGGLGVGVDPTTGHVVTDNTVTYQGSYKLKNTPDVNVGGPASGPCNGFSGGLGVSMAGISVGANASTVDEGCSARETARIAAMVGRMDIANAILDNLPIVQAAMKAKGAREALALPPKSEETPATTAPAQSSPAPVPMQTQAQREAALKEQQLLAQGALQRQATMAKLNDTLKFTDATTQASEKTPQQAMAEEANKMLAAKAQEANPPQASASPLPSATQQANQSDGQAITTPLPLPQMIKPAAFAQAADGRSSPGPQPTSTLGGPPQTKKLETATITDSKTTPAPATVEDRVKAAKAALNLP